MSSEGSEKRSYVVPRYRAAGDPAFFHFLHGTVPGHQIDFMYCPEVPQGALTQTHFGHLARLIKYIEPRGASSFAFALGNLSRDDIQHEPGHGGLALLFALRVPGVTDHAGRDMPPYAHGVVAIDRQLDFVTLLEAATVFYRLFLEREGAEDQRGRFYRTYVRTVQEQPEDLDRFLATYIGELRDLPYASKSKLAWDFVADEAAPPKQIVIVHDDHEPFGTIAHHAAVLGSVLYRSNVKWTSITTGREIEIAGGTTVRFVARSEAGSDGRTARHAIEDLPSDEDELAMLLFGAKRRVEEVAAPRQGWREKMAADRAASGALPARSERPPPPRTPLPPPSDSVDRAERAGSIDWTEPEDAAATLPMAPLEAIPSCNPARSAPAPAVSPPASFNARQSSSTRGMAAVDLRGSSPVGGMRGVTMPAEAMPAAQPAPLPLPPLPPASSPAPVSVSHDEIDVVVEPRSGKGRWIAAGAALVAAGVIAVVAIATGTSPGSEEPGGTGSVDTTAPSPSATGDPAPVPSSSHHATSPFAPTSASTASAAPGPPAPSASTSAGTTPASPSTGKKWEPRRSSPAPKDDKKAGGKPVF